MFVAEAVERLEMCPRRADPRIGWVFWLLHVLFFTEMLEVLPDDLWFSTGYR